jgi:pentatricopeptide repeat protein
VALLGAAVDSLGRQRQWHKVMTLLQQMEEAYFGWTVLGETFNILMISIPNTGVWGPQFL